MAQTTEVTPDGWITTDLRLFRALTEYAPPRPWGYWDQIRADMHDPKIVVRMWLTGLGLTAAGVVLPAAAVITGQWILALGGLLLVGGLPKLLLWAYLAQVCVRAFRVQPLATGVIDRFDPHPHALTNMPLGSAIRASGEAVNVGAELPLARAIERGGTPAEVWFIDDPTWEYRPVFAGRSVGRANHQVGKAAEFVRAPDRCSEK